MVRPWHGAGDVNAEYVALLMLIGACVVALGGTSERIAEGARRALCLLFQAGRCSDVTGKQPAEERNRMGLPCLTRRDLTDMELSLLVKGVEWDRGAGHAVEQLGAGTYRVTLYGEDAAGVGFKTGVGRARSAEGAVTLGGRASNSYDFATREQAEAFARAHRGGWKQWAHLAGGTPGHAVSQGWEWLRRQINDRMGRGRGPEVSVSSVAVRVRADGELSYSAGLDVKGEGVGAVSGVLTRIHTNGWSAYTASLDGTAAVALTKLLRAGAGAGGALRYRVFFDEDGEPIRFTRIREVVYIGKGGFKSGVVEASYGRSKVHIDEDSLDLRDPVNRAAFDRAFVTVPGVYAQPRIDDAAALDAFDERMRLDGVEVDLEYDQAAPSLKAKDTTVMSADDGRKGGMLGAGVYGAEFVAEDLRRDLVSATILDRRWVNPEPRVFDTCWSDTGGPGLPSGGGDPGDGPGP